MSKELVNYKSTSSTVIKRSPAINGRKQVIPHVVLSGNVKISQISNFRKSMSQNIDILNKVLQESRRILPNTPPE